VAIARERATLRVDTMSLAASLHTILALKFINIGVIRMQRTDMIMIPIRSSFTVKPFEQKTKLPHGRPFGFIAHSSLF
jgi:hypothetical protein